ncbi:Crp/Fnr family transcriptional regulator [Paenibacillus mesophilus]|uniref:Crp/Fnr family transcriptional regulator n=1 Tax=Paenibacillus mesophilus TaxID=2582849 RepID=UPI001EE41412|nr:Crp/Fnr family transcriptional regulator [Paenibacillus mesophilus]
MTAHCMEQKTKSVSSGEGNKPFLSKTNFDKWSGLMTMKTAAAGTRLFWEGEPAGKLYYIQSGRVKTKKTTEDGKDLILSVLGRGDLIGEFGAYGDTTHSYCAEVYEDAEIGVVQERDLEALLRRDGEFAVEFMKWIGLMNRIVQSKFRDLLLYGKPGALASTLIRMSNTYGTLDKDGIRIELKMTNSDMAELIGTTRESVNRMLSSLKEEGTISVSDNRIVIRRIDDLRRVCNCPSYPACPKEICRL